MTFENRHRSRRVPSFGGFFSTEEGEDQVDRRTMKLVDYLGVASRLGTFPNDAVEDEAVRRNDEHVWSRA